MYTYEYMYSHVFPFPPLQDLWCGEGKGASWQAVGTELSPSPLLLGNPRPAFLGPVSSEATQYPALEAAAQR